MFPDKMVIYFIEYFSKDRIFELIKIDSLLTNSIFFDDTIDNLTTRGHIREINRLKQLS